MTKTILSAAVAVALTFAIVGCNQKEHDHGVQHETSEQAAERAKAGPTKVGADQKVVPVSVDAKGFTPSRIDVTKGADTTLQFTRTTDSTCAKKVVFPEINVSKDLPLNQAVAVKVPTSEARTLTFQCGMGMYKSAVVIN